MECPPEGQYEEYGRRHNGKHHELELDGEIEVISTAIDIWPYEVVVFARGKRHVCSEELDRGNTG